jgi:hypothetical protein
MTKYISRDASISFNPKGLSGQRSRKLVNARLGRFGRANRGRVLSDEEKRAVESDLKRSGRLAP